MSMTVKEIAQIAGVSPATVSLVLNNKGGVSEQTRNRVRKILLETNYVLPQTRKIAKRKHIWFLKFAAHGMLVEENQGFISSIIDKIESNCQKHAINLIMRHVNNDTFEEVIHEIALDPQDGAFLLGTELAEKHTSILSTINVPLVVIDHSMMRVPAVDSVVMSNEEIVYEALLYLKSLGFREVGYLPSRVNTSNFMERNQSFFTSVKDLALKSMLTLPLTPTLTGAYKEAKAFLEKNSSAIPHAILAANDSIAIGAMKAFQEAGYEIPKDVSFIGIDDITFSAMSAPPLTTMRISRAQIGDLAFQTLMHRIAEPELPYARVSVGARLVLRSSVAYG